MGTLLQNIGNYFVKLYQNITIEPLMIVYYASLNLMELYRTNLKLDRFCKITLNHTAEDCNTMYDNSSDRNILIEAQQLDQVFVVWEYLVALIIPIILIIFLSTWSDIHGRKKIMLAPLVGAFVYAFLYFLTAIFTSWPPEVLLVASFLRSLGGSHMLFLMGAYAYMSDISSHGARTSRMAVLTALMSLGNPIGTSLGPVLFNAAADKWSGDEGFQVVFGTSAGLLVIVFIWTAIVVKDSNTKTNTDLNEFGGCFKTGISYVTGLFGSAFKKRHQRRRTYILVLVLLMLLNICAIPQKLYVWSEVTLGWQIEEFSQYYSIYSLTCHMIILGLTPLIRWSNIHDCITAAVAVGLKVLKTVALSFVTSSNGSWVLYAFIWTPDGLESLAIRSLLTKVCEPSEAGRMMALLAITEAIWPLLDILLYSWVYYYTVGSYASAVHVVSSCFGILVFVMLLWMRFAMKKSGLDEEFKAADQHPLNKNDDEGVLVQAVESQERAAISKTISLS